MSIRRVVVMQICGGLGNQLFQYGLGLWLSLRLKSKLLIDLSWFSRSSIDTPRPFLLDRFSLDLTVARPGLVHRFELAQKLHSLAARMRMSRLVPPGLTRYFVEDGFGYDKRVNKLRPPIYLAGFWQSPRYIDGIRHELLQAVVPKRNLTTRLAGLLSRVESPGYSVAVHVRRGDYVSSSAASRYHGVCDTSYYRRALAEMGSRTTVERLFVFTDDPAWVRENLMDLHPTMELVDYDLDLPEQHLFVMSRCRNFIIANSTFSWWAAWLSPNENKIVMYPSRWFAQGPDNTKDLFPAAWIAV